MANNLEPIGHAELRMVELINLACESLKCALKALEHEKMSLLIGQEAANRVYGQMKNDQQS